MNTPEHNGEQWVPWDVPRIDIEWDEPGAGGIIVNGDRLVNFSIGTDWSESWNPQVNAKALAFIDALPRIVTEVQFAYDCAKRYEAEARIALSEQQPDNARQAAEEGNHA